MTDYKQILLDNAESAFLAGNILTFSQTIQELYNSHITCNCFFEKQPKLLWKSLLNKADTILDNDTDFNLNLAKGFVHLKNENKLEAVDYLTKSLQINPVSDLCYSLRATLDIDINPERENDAKDAVILNPTARNYFILGNVFGDDQPEKAITFFEKAIAINSGFACAYNNKALKHKFLKDYKSAVYAYKKCIEIDPNHWCYYSLWYCLHQINSYQEALDYLIKGHEIHPDSMDYHYALGYESSKRKNFTEAINHFEMYLEYNPNDKSTIEHLQFAKVELGKEFLKKAKQLYSSGDFIKSKTDFENYQELGNRLLYEDMQLYYKALLKSADQDKELGLLNIHYKRLSILKTDYLDKTSKGEPLTEDEENINKLMKYQIHYHLGFGIYEGWTLQEIIETDSAYINWCVVNLYHFCIDSVLFLEKNLKREDNYIEALEINLIKNELLEDWAENEQEDESWDGGYDDYHEEYPSFEEWLNDEFADDAETAYWNLD